LVFITECESIYKYLKDFQTSSVNSYLSALVWNKSAVIYYTLPKQLNRYILAKTSTDCPLNMYILWQQRH